MEKKYFGIFIFQDHMISQTINQNIMRLLYLIVLQNMMTYSKTFLTKHIIEMF